jgi:4-aminobutyrate aminotransferase/4-aminobutyrate aminotransferase/(S)-3-amino-2-methylpropionate transaminase
VAAIILEPVQGEGGFYAAPADFMRGLRAICDEHGILLIADEVQTGYGRTGKLFAMEHYDVLPDLITMAKSLAGGMPLSAVNGRAEIMDAPAPAAWAAPMPATRWRGLGAGGAGRDGRRKAGGPWPAPGRQAAGTPQRMRSAVPQIAEVRGVGAMVAVEFADPATGKPDAEYTKKVQQHALNTACCC